MEILVSLSNVKVQDTSAKVTVEAGKATKTKPAMAKIIVSTAAKKNAATITFKPTAEATIEKPKYEARLNRMGKGFRMKNAAECIQALKVFGFDPKDAAPIREFYSGKITAAQFKKAMGTKSYQHKDDAKAADVVKMINATKLPTSGKGKVTRKMVDGIFADYQTFPIIREADVKKLLKAIGDFNDGKLKPTALKSIRGLFARSKTNARNPKVAAMGKKFNAVIDLMESTEAPSGSTARKAPMKKPPVKKASKAESVPAPKVSGSVVTDGNLSVELPTNSKLTAAEANKIIGYFSQLLENKEVAKAQANRALKDLASGEMTQQMKKRWLARVGTSEIRPVPRKLVTLLREEPSSKPVTRLKSRGQQTPAKKRKDTVRPTANSTPHAIAKAITKAGYKGTLAARQRGDLIEIYNVSDNSVVWSWNRKTFKAIDFTQERTNKMYSTLNLDGMKQTEKVDTVASILNDM